MVSAVRSIPGLTALFAGHWHVLSLDQFSGKAPLEIISGNGGTAMDPPQHTGKIMDSQNIASYFGQQYYDFGYIRLDRDGPSTWILQEKDPSGKTVLRCVMNETSATLQCTPGA